MISKSNRFLVTLILTMMGWSVLRTFYVPWFLSDLFILFQVLIIWMKIRWCLNLKIYLMGIEGWDLDMKEWDLCLGFWKSDKILFRSRESNMRMQKEKLKRILISNDWGYLFLGRVERQNKEISLGYGVNLLKQLLWVSKQLNFIHFTLKSINREMPRVLWMIFLTFPVFSIFSAWYFIW